MNNLRQLLRRGNNFRCNESGLFELHLIAIHSGSQGMTNGCPGLIKKIGIHQNMTEYDRVCSDHFLTSIFQNWPVSLMIFFLLCVIFF